MRSGEGYLVMVSRGLFWQVWRVVVRWITVAVDWGMVLRGVDWRGRKGENMFKMLMTGSQAMQIVKDYITKDIAHSNVTEAVLALEKYIKSLEKSVK